MYITSTKDSNKADFKVKERKITKVKMCRSTRKQILVLTYCRYIESGWDIKIPIVNRLHTVGGRELILPRMASAS